MGGSTAPHTRNRLQVHQDTPGRCPRAPPIAAPPLMGPHTCRTHPCTTTSIHPRPTADVLASSKTIYAHSLRPSRMYTRAPASVRTHLPGTGALLRVGRGAGGIQYLQVRVQRLATGGRGPFRPPPLHGDTNQRRDCSRSRGEKFAAHGRGNMFGLVGARCFRERFIAAAGSCMRRLGCIYYSAAGRVH